MQFDTKQQEAIRQYLLGQARPEDSSSLEERLVTDGEFYRELLIAEDELIDAYLSGELSEVERASFENYFLLMPERQQKVRFGRALNKYVASVEPLPDEDPLAEDLSAGTRAVPKPPPKPGPGPWYTVFLPSRNPILAYSLVAALVLIVGAASWFALKKWKNPGSGQTYAVILAPGGATRSGGGEKTKQVSIPPGTDTVRLQLNLNQAEYPTYSAQVESSELEPIYSHRDLKAEVAGKLRMVKLDIPAQLLTAGDFRIKLSGVQAGGSEESVATYYLKVSSR